ncbi:MAG: 2-amino-4-hydroxy-6-hydroxymethyldihydropteridine diphosphokinase [Owenweeksia sp.]
MAILRKNSQGNGDKLYHSVILMGGNLGKVKETFKKAMHEIEALGELTATSSLYQTEAWGMNNAPDFYNQILILETALKPVELMRELLGIERSLGRDRTVSEGYASRVIDLDILFIDDMVIDEEGLRVPHPRLQERNFVLEPLCEVMPGYIHPELKRSIAELRTDLDDPLSVRKL